MFLFLIALVISGTVFYLLLSKMEKFFNFISPGGIQADEVGSPLASSDTITPDRLIHEVTGTEVISTIIPPYPDFMGPIFLLAEDSWSWDDNGNITVPSDGDVVPGLAYPFFFNRVRSLWYPIVSGSAPLEPLEASFTIDVNGQGPSGGQGAQTTGWTGDSTVTGGSGSYTYAWTVWNESSSEGAPLYTSTSADPNFPPSIPATCIGQAKLVVTDTVTLESVTVGPSVNDWDWDCV